MLYIVKHLLKSHPYTPLRNSVEPSYFYDMSSDILRPLAAFRDQQKTQRYVKAVRNLDEAVDIRSKQQRSADTDDRTISIETAFDLDLKIKSHSSEQGFSVSLELPSLGKGAQATAAGTETTSPPEAPRYYTVHAEYGTDFLWYDANHPRHGKVFVEDISDELSSFPRAVPKNYKTWVTTYNTNFKASCYDSRYSSPSVFFTTAEDVAWNVAGFLLAWRIALAPHVGSVTYLSDCKEYLLEKGNATDVTLRFLADQAAVLEKGAFSE